MNARNHERARVAANAPYVALGGIVIDPRSEPTADEQRIANAARAAQSEWFREYGADVEPPVNDVDGSVRPEWLYILRAVIAAVSSEESAEHPCRALGHLPMSPHGGECARCGDPVFSLPDGTPWPPDKEQTP